MESSESTAEDMMTREIASTEWTDEKHSLYLKSMETSFVNQLYKSMDLGGCSELTLSNPRSLQRHDKCNHPCEFKVLRDGCWDTINFHNQQCTSNTSHVLFKSPWIQHFRSSQKCGSYPPSTMQKLASATMPNPREKYSQQSHSRKSHSRHHHAIDCNAEVSDQNFVDENNEEPKATRRCLRKGIKNAPEASFDDQVVPFGKRPLP